VSILLSTLNARFSHASLGLRYLMANMGQLAPITQLQEFVIGIRAADAVEKLLAHQPRIIGFGQKFHTNLKNKPSSSWRIMSLQAGAI